MLFRIVIALIAGTGAALAAPAANPSVDRDTLRQYCSGDYLTYCGNYAPDTAEVRACFKQNKARLSPNCQAAITGFVRSQRRAEAR